VLPSFILLPVRRRTTLEATLIAMPSTSAINHGNDTEDSAGALVFVDFVAIPYCVCDETNLMVTNDRRRDHALLWPHLVFMLIEREKDNQQAKLHPERRNQYLGK